MVWNLIESNWTQFKCSVKATWTKINDYNLYVIAGNRDRHESSARLGVYQHG